MWLQIAKLSVKCFCYKHLLVICRNHMNPFPPRTTVTYSGQSCFFHVSFPEPLDPSFIQDEHLTHQDQSNFYGNLWLQIRFIHFLFEARADYPPKPGAVALVQVKRMCQCFDHCLKQFGYSKKINIEWLHDPEILLLSIYPKEFKAGTWAGTCIPIFITALFVITKRWKQTKCPSTDEWINKMCVCIHTYI